MDREYFGYKPGKGKYDNFKYTNSFEKGRHSYSLGGSTHPMKEALSELKSKIRAGIKNIEINLQGMGKGSVGQGKIPAGAYGATRRREIKSLADVNKVTRSVHAPINLSMATLDKQGNFRKKQHEKIMEAFEETINFAHDIGGENVVVHTSTARRHFPQEGEKWEKFREKEKEKGRIYTFIDKETGEGFNIPEDARVPVWEVDGEIKPLGSEVEEEEREGWDMRMMEVGEAVKEGLKPRELFESRWNAEKMGAEGQIKRFEGMEDRYTKGLHALEDFDPERLEELRNRARRGELSPSEREELERLSRKGKRIRRAAYEVGGAPEDIEEKEGIREYLDKRRKWVSNALASAKAEKERYDVRSGNLEPANKYLQEKAIKSTVRLAKKSYDKYKESGKKVAVTPENMYPRWYGGHPDELKKLINRSREEFKEELRNKGVKKDKAEGLARDFIGATFDVAHADIWSRYWDKSKEEFREWIGGKAEELAEEGTMKELHVSDSFGYEDQHLALGEGKVPNKEVVERLEKKGIPIRVIAEGGGPGARGTKHVTRAQEHLGKTLYPGGPTYGEARGRIYGRSFTYETAPRTRIGKSKETWSGVPI